MIFVVYEQNVFVARVRHTKSSVLDIYNTCMGFVVVNLMGEKKKIIVSISSFQKHKFKY